MLSKLEYYNSGLFAWCSIAFYSVRLPEEQLPDYSLGLSFGRYEIIDENRSPLWTQIILSVEQKTLRLYVQSSCSWLTRGVLFCFPILFVCFLILGAAHQWRTLSLILGAHSSLALKFCAQKLPHPSPIDACVIFICESENSNTVKVNSGSYSTVLPRQGLLCPYQLFFFFFSKS